MCVSDDYKAPLAARVEDLTRCLGILGEHPLKLVAGKLFREYSESEWTNPIWSFSSDGGKLEDKKLLINTEDTFQLSVANERSKQDFHKHTSVFDIYISDSPIEITYFESSNKRTLKIPNGVMIVPPGIYHKAKLHGLTFVFQATPNGERIDSDKQRLEFFSNESK